MQSIRVMIVDDHALFRDSISHMLAHYDDMEVAASAASGAQALQALDDTEVDVVLLDFDLGSEEPDGLEVLKLIQRKRPDLPVVIVSMYAERHIIVSAAQAGASGYVLKSSPGEDLVRAVREVAAGRGWLSPDAAHGLLDAIAADKVAASQNPAERHGLDERECRILACVAQGMAYRDVSDIVHISESRVKAIMRKICEKLGARGQAQATAIAVAEGIIPRPVLSDGA